MHCKEAIDVRTCFHGYKASFKKAPDRKSEERRRGGGTSEEEKRKKTSPSIINFCFDPPTKSADIYEIQFIHHSIEQRRQNRNASNFQIVTLPPGFWLMRFDVTDTREKLNHESVDTS
ncbi:hypothetical protein CEXT_598561 [Caerostris extrusa]|uniref:Uncharacterized protein n=1 Tax=Caerostris extrusa TaxID=172846 RepID=A0AAV4SSH9_CAEEX|nr:hypothetical protein CEXT_598561 [Caerostris extrusa]